MEVMVQLRCILLRYFSVSFSSSGLGYKRFCYNIVFCYVSIKLQLGSVFFINVNYFLLRRNYFIYLLDIITFSDDIRITLYFGTFELRTEITL